MSMQSFNLIQYSRNLDFRKGNKFLVGSDDGTPIICSVHLHDLLSGTRTCICYSDRNHNRLCAVADGCRRKLQIRADENDDINEALELGC